MRTRKLNVFIFTPMIITTYFLNGWHTPMHDPLYVEQSPCFDFERSNVGKENFANKDKVYWSSLYMISFSLKLMQCFVVVE